MSTVLLMVTALAGTEGVSAGAQGAGELRGDAERGATLFVDYTCYGCHEHSRSKIREEHVEEGIRDYENCVEGHRSGDEDEAKRIWRSKDFSTDKLRPDDKDRNKERKYERGPDDDDD